MFYSTEIFALWAIVLFIHIFLKKTPGQSLIKNLRLAVSSGEKKTFFTAKRPHLLALNALIFVISDFSGKVCFSPHSPDFLQKKGRTGVRTDCAISHLLQ